MKLLLTIGCAVFCAAVAHAGGIFVHPHSVWLQPHSLCVAFANDGSSKKQEDSGNEATEVTVFYADSEDGVLCVAFRLPQYPNTYFITENANISPE
jgi:hypothetical protein